IQLERIDTVDQLAMIPDVERNETDIGVLQIGRQEVPRPRTDNVQVGQSGKSSVCQFRWPDHDKRNIGTLSCRGSDQIEIEPFREGAHIYGTRSRYRRIGSGFRATRCKMVDVHPVGEMKLLA